MKATIVKVGNSRGVRIPKPVFEQCGFQDEVEMHIHKNTLIISSPHQTRQGWDDAFQSMAKSGDDKMPEELGKISSAWDDTEWKWK